MAKEQSNAPQVTVTDRDLIPYIKKQGELLSEQVSKAKEKYGSRYNTKNKVEEMYHRFGNPKWEPERFAKEYFLIMQKKSNLPATVRYPVQDICAAAMNECYHDKMMTLIKQQEAERKAAEEKKEE